MRYVAFDLETNGLLDTVSKVHQAILTDLETLETYGYTDEPWKVQGASQEPSGTIQEALDIVAEADLFVTFNGWGYDMLVLEKLYPEWTYKGYHLDLMVHGTCIRPYDQLLQFDAKLAAKGKLPRYLIGAESLKAWAIRAKLDQQKDEYRGSWEELNPDMWRYGLQDGPTTAALYHWMMQPRFRIPWQTMWIEQEVGRLVGRQQRNGWRIDVAVLQQLDTELSQEVQAAKDTMAQAFGAWYRADKQKLDSLLFRNPKGRWKAFRKEDVPVNLLDKPGYKSWPVKVPKRSLRRQSGVEKSDGTQVRSEFTEGAPYTPIELHRFNPNARQDVYKGLNHRYGWEPKQRTAKGAPKVSSETLKDLEWTEAQAAHRFYLLDKIHGYTTNWLKKERNGRLHGRVNPNRANTRRMTHQDPNLANVPAKGALYGEECRRVFRGDDGWVQVGADAEQLELRCLAKRLYRYDGGAYAEEVQHGDVHTLHISVAAGLDREAVTEDIRKGGKGVTYGWLYGAGDATLGKSCSAIPGVRKRSGKKVREGYEQGITGVAQLLSYLERMLADRGYILALDGGKLYSRSLHSRLNLQLQSDGALIMKAAWIFADHILSEAELVEGRDFKWVGNVHDELQATAKPELAEQVGQAMVDGMLLAGKWFGFPVPIDGKYMIGNNWSETH
jgi:DNA polymerase I-like protein with 3'-5' exonuclease and polymerase domains